MSTASTSTPPCSHICVRVCCACKIVKEKGILSNEILHYNCHADTDWPMWFNGKMFQVYKQTSYFQHMWK